MIERALRFGEGRNLVGVLTETETGGPEGERPGVVFLNSGILHRVGASRLYVLTARRLAGAGFPSIRFDHSGIGDSEVRRDGRGFEESAIAEARAAMDLLAERRGVRSFILAGLCSGADVAYWTALEDERVVGLAQLDPFAYRTWGYTRRHYLPRLVSPRAWWASVRGRSRAYSAEVRAWRRGDEVESVWVAPEYTRVFPPREQVAENLGRLNERGVAFYAFISRGLSDRVNYAGQYRESFPEVEFGDRLVVDYAPEANHTVTRLEDQERVVAGIERWALERWGGEAASGVVSGVDQSGGRATSRPPASPETVRTHVGRMAGSE